MSHDDLAFLCRGGASLLTDLLDLVIESLLLIEVPDLVAIGLLFEVVTLLISEGLPLLSDFLHDLQGTHLFVLIDDDRSRL